MEDKYLPRDIHTIILAHLPVKSLLQFKSVCKSWATIIKDRDFVELHRRTRATTNNGNCVLIRHFQRNPYLGNVYALLQYCSETGNVTCDNILDLPFSKEDDKLDIEVAVPCNGIICISDGGQDIILWNPAIREFKLLPPTSYTATPPDSFHEDFRCFCVGFGFDPSTDDYKVVRIWISNDEYLYRHQTVKVEVYSLTADSWKSIESIPTIRLSEPGTGQVYLNGKYYWLIEHSQEQYNILSFDLVKEVFEVIELPDADSHSFNGSWDRLVVMKDSTSGEILEVIESPEGRSDNGSWEKLLMMGNSLAMVSYTHPVNENCFFHIWLMEEDCASVSWRKFFTIGPFYEYDAPLGFWKNDELLFKFELSARIIAYNNATKSVREIFENFDVDEFLPVAIYNESLVSLSRGSEL